MDRRRFLAGAGTAGALSLAGCAALDDTTDANALFVEEGADRYFSFSADGTEVATAGVRFYGGHETADPVGFRFWSRPEVDAALADLRLELTHENRNGDIYMKPPYGRPWPDLGYREPENDWGAVVEVPDLGAQAASTLALGFLYDPWVEVDGPALGFDVSFAVESSGVLPTRYRCDARRDIPVPAET